VSDEIRKTCVSCGYDGLRPGDDRMVCENCEENARRCLRLLAGHSGLFARLVWLGPDALIPGQRAQQGGGGGGTQVDAPAPVRLGPMNLLGAGGVVNTLQRWVAAWYDELGFRQPVWRGAHQFVTLINPAGHKVSKPGQLDNAVTILLNNLPWAVEHRRDFGKFNRDVSGFVRQIKSALDPTATPPARVRIGRCPLITADNTRCGNLLEADPFAPSIHCWKCGANWDRADWPRLSDHMNNS
jgi:hypothetical protein